MDLIYLLFASTKEQQLLLTKSRAGRSMDTGFEIHHRLNVANLWINFFTTSIPAFSSFKDRMYSWVKSRNRGHFPKSCPRRRDSVRWWMYIKTVGFQKKPAQTLLNSHCYYADKLQEKSISAHCSNVLPTNDSISNLFFIPTWKTKFWIMKQTTKHPKNLTYTYICVALFT